MECGWALSGPQSCFQLLAQPLVFLLEPFNRPLLSFNLPLLSFDLSLGLL
jgi:hypothetical protein